MHLAPVSISAILTTFLVLGPAAAGDGLTGPVGRWFGGDHQECGSCHQPGGKGPDAATCIGCHEEIGRSGSGGTVPASYEQDSGSGHIIPGEMYRPRRPQGGTTVQAVLDCLSCHNPHGGAGDSTVLRERQGPAVLTQGVQVDAVSRFCVGCHEDMSRFSGTGRGYSRHPVGVPAGMVQDPYLQALPLADVRGTEDRSDDVVACTTCHFVHNGPNPYLLRWDRSVEGRFCGQCHIQGRPQDESPNPRRMARLR